MFRTRRPADSGRSGSQIIENRAHDVGSQSENNPNDRQQSHDETSDSHALVGGTSLVSGLYTEATQHDCGNTGDAAQQTGNAQPQCPSAQGVLLRRWPVRTHSRGIYPGLRLVRVLRIPGVARIGARTGLAVVRILIRVVARHEKDAFFHLGNNAPAVLMLGCCWQHAYAKGRLHAPAEQCRYSPVGAEDPLTGCPAPRKASFAAPIVSVP